MVLHLGARVVFIMGSPGVLGHSRWCSLLGVIIRLDRVNNKCRGWGESGTGQATSKVQRNVTGAQAQIQPARAAPQGARGQGRHGAQVVHGTGGPLRLFSRAR
ncbi:hypothetical protein KY284_020289 [Solanum tuberosum]|nr:hypothetical protein KY284_020289 [Solanum tuberosum]